LPGDFIGDRPVSSFIHPAGLPIATPFDQVLRRPLESALAAAVGVVNQLDVGTGAAVRERHPQRVEHEVGAHVAGELPTHHPAAEGVDDEGEEHQALPAAQIGEVGHPQLVGPAGGEVALDQVWPALGVRVRAGGAPRLAAALGALDARRRIRRLTRSRPTSTPARCSAFHVRR
jgi:hypothetical protein